MNKKIFRSLFFSCMITLIIGMIFISVLMYGYLNNRQKQVLKEQLDIMLSLSDNPNEIYTALESYEYRVTWISSDGQVLLDNQKDSSSMENHISREEVIEALQTGEGDGSRLSISTLKNTVYYARAMSDGSIIRLSIDSDIISQILMQVALYMLLMIVVMVFILRIAGRRITDSIMKPLTSLNLDEPLENDSYEELSFVLMKISRQQKQLDIQMKQLEQKTDEFEQITSNIREGIILLDDSGIVVSINKAARQLLGTSEACVGEDFLLIDRNTNIMDAIEKSRVDGKSSVKVQMGDGIYRFDMNRIISDGQDIGTAILAYDVTSLEEAAKSRAEFTANVSHELKTPLQSIIGSAELLAGDMVAKEDEKRFIEKIVREGHRLIELINDIINLSRLDEGEDIQLESISLYDSVIEAVSDLGVVASDKGVGLDVNLDRDITIKGNARLAYEVAFNIIDNAIKYSPMGSSVQVRLERRGTKAVLGVSDKGIGIPLEHRDRIFERFYRVDKSRGRSDGGTGLGLSIVKHAVSIMNGQIELESAMGEGTKIEISFEILV